MSCRVRFVDILDFNEMQRGADRRGQSSLQKANSVMLGITKASLATELLPVSSILPGDHQGSDRGGDQR